MEREKERVKCLTWQGMRTMAGCNSVARKQHCTPAIRQNKCKCRCAHSNIQREMMMKKKNIEINNKATNGCYKNVNERRNSTTRNSHKLKLMVICMKYCIIVIFQPCEQRDSPRTVDYACVALRHYSFIACAASMENEMGNEFMGCRSIE